MSQNYIHTKNRGLSPIYKKNIINKNVEIVALILGYRFIETATQGIHIYIYTLARTLV